MFNLKNQRIAIYAQDKFSAVTSKVATSFIRYHEQDCIAVIDRQNAGKTVQDVLGYGGDIPIVNSIVDILDMKPEVLMIGTGLYSNELPEDYRNVIKFAIESKMNVVSGLHYRISKDAELAELAKLTGSLIWDTKEPPADLKTNEANLDEVDAFVIHTVGSDCRVGKKTTSLELVANLKNRGVNIGFAASGQGGIYISGSGYAVDAVPSDFIAGVTERLVKDSAKDHDWVVLEGQGSISHPAYSGVTLGLLHGGMPQALILCHEAHLTAHKNWDHVATLPLPTLVTLYEQLASCQRTAKVVAVSVNCRGLDKAAAALYIKEIEAQTGLPATDVMLFGADKLADALQTYKASL